MASILSYDPIRELPIYREGVSAGINIGTWQSLNVIVAELAHQEDAAIVAAVDDPHGQSAARYEHTAGRLLVVARIVAGRFRAAR